MYKTWTGSAPDAETLARELEVHLNEYAEEIISIGYAVTKAHHVLAVYRALDPSVGIREETAVAVAEQILDEQNM